MENKKYKEVIQVKTEITEIKGLSPPTSGLDNDYL